MLVANHCTPESIGDLINEALTQDFKTFRAAVAFVKLSGLKHILERVAHFKSRGGSIEFVIGIDHFGTSLEALETLLRLVDEKDSVFIRHDENPFTTFHPKIYIFEDDQKCLALIGSGNLTHGGLYGNDEASSRIELNLRREEDKHSHKKLLEVFSYWKDTNWPTVRKLNKDFLEELKEQNYLLPELLTSSEPNESNETKMFVTPKRIKILFGTQKAIKTRPQTGSALPGDRIPIPNGFVMTLMQTDTGVGQTTPGTARRSPEVFVPLTARDTHPLFWGWPQEFVEDSTKTGKFDRRNVRMLIGGQAIAVNMMTWPDKHDFRLRSEDLRSAGQIGDLLKIELIADGTRGADYYATIVPQGTKEHELYFSLCTNRTPNSERLWGYY